MVCVDMDKDKSMRDLRVGEQYTLVLDEYCDIKREHLNYTKFSDIEDIAYNLNTHYYNNHYSNYTVSIVCNPREVLLSKVDSTARMLLVDLHNEYAVNDVNVEEDIFYFNDSDVQAMAEHLTEFYKADRYNHRHIIMETQTFEFE